MKTVIVGAGGQGGPCASILAKDSDCESILLMDIDETLLNAVKKKIDSEKLIPMVADAGSLQDLAKKSKGADVIIDLAPPWLSPNIIKAALSVDAYYVNTAYDYPFWDEIVAGDELSFNRDFKEAGLTALLGCGMAPGILNVMASYYAGQYKTIDSIKLRIAKKNLSDPPYSDLVGVWNPGWSPKQALIDCATPAICLRNGQYERMPDYSEIEEWVFPQPIGKMPVSHHSHEEPYSLSRVYSDKGLKNCDFKYFVTAQAATLVKMGLASEKEINVKGVMVKPIDVVMELIPKPGNDFLSESKESLARKDELSFVSMMIEIKGIQNGRPVEKLIHLPNLQKPAVKLYDLFGTSMVNVALPAVIGAKMILQGAKKGIIFAEELDPKRFIQLFKESGHPWSWAELK